MSRRYSHKMYAGNQQSEVTYPVGRGVPIYNPPTPFVQNIGELSPDNIIYICGTPDPKASRFTVTLRKGRHTDSDIVAMAFDVRFMWGNPVSENVVVRNYRVGKYNDSDEERHMPYFPFKRNATFEMIILVTAHCFKVAVNNKHFIEFNHRVTPLSSIDTVCIDGDVKLNQVRFQE